MSRASDGPHRQDNAGTAAWGLSAIGVGAGLVTLLSTYLPTPPGFATGQVRAVSFAAIGIGLVIQLVPWRRLSPGSTLWLMPIAFALIGWHNYAGGTDPFRYGIFFLTVFLWVGLFQPRGTSLWLAPMAAVSYLAPLLIRDQPAYVVYTVFYSVPVYVATAEILAMRSRALRQTEQRLRVLAERDPLTGLNNREVFLREVDRAAENGRPGVLFVDIDDFKLVNDEHGHAAGDEVLRQVAHAIGSSVRAEDLVARLAGDEFGVLLRSVADDGDAAGRAVAEAVLQRLHGIVLPDGTALHASVGLAFAALGAQAISSEELVARADAAMYDVKRHGKDAVALAG